MVIGGNGDNYNECLTTDEQILICPVDFVNHQKLYHNPMVGPGLKVWELRLYGILWWLSQ